MQQALRVSDMTAFFNAITSESGEEWKVGYLVEFNETEKIFKNESLPEDKETSLKELEDQEKIKEDSDELADVKSSDNA